MGCRGRVIEVDNYQSIHSNLLSRYISITVGDQHRQRVCPFARSTLITQGP